MLPLTISTERLTLRQFELRDLDGYIAYYTGPRTAGVGAAKPRHVVVERFYAMAGQWAIRGYGRYAIDLGGQAIGHVGVLHIEETAPEMTWTLWDPAFEGRGYATEAAKAVLSAWSGPRLRADVDRENTPSIRVAERVGFVEDETAHAPDFMPNARVFFSPETVPA